jgi:cyclopropane fatty-acyl-phospholipid synthase-like methyltransferase
VPLTYHSGIFDVKDMAQAMGIILTPEGVTTEERWQTETPYLVDLINASMEITAQSILVDYGCGIGRMAKELIIRHGCNVIGVDISPSMRALAVMYVGSDRFCSCSPAMFDTLLSRGFKVDAAVSIWVLQHCLTPVEDIGRLHRGLKPGAGLFILNEDHRVVPTTEQGWVNDGVDVKAILNEEFMLKQEGRPSLEKMPEALARRSFWASYRQRA